MIITRANITVADLYVLVLPPSLTNDKYETQD